MPLLSNDELRNQIRTALPARSPHRFSYDQKFENINSFNQLPREGLVNGTIENRLLLYETLIGEKIFMQYPGIESAREGNRRFELDAKPVLQKKDGTFTADMDFRKIWDVIDRIGKDHHADIDILATIFLQIAYMLNYRHNERNYTIETIDIASGRVIEVENRRFIWNSLDFSNDVLETINDRFTTHEGISLEGFLYYNDLLAQNEDCKYHYFKGDTWDLRAGRINNCLSHLTVISHIRGYIGISKLIDSFQRTGVAPLPQYRLSEACGELVVIY